MNINTIIRAVVLAGTLIPLNGWCQVKTNNQVSSVLGGESVFLDASSFSNSPNVGKGISFPRVNLTTFTFVTQVANALKFPTGYDGMIVYNTASGMTPASGAGVQTMVRPGFYYFRNPGTVSNVSAGQWVAISVIHGNGQPTQTAALGTLYMDDLSGNLYKRVSSGWELINGGSSSADGDAWGVEGENQAGDIARTGKVTIGSLTPGPQRLTVIGSGDVFGADNAAFFSAKNSAGTYERYFWPRWSDNVMYMNYGSGGLNIRDNSSQSALFINSGRNVGIGTLTPGAKLHVESGMANTSGLRLGGLTSASPAGTSEAILAVDANGNVVRSKTPIFQSSNGGTAYPGNIITKLDPVAGKGAAVLFSGRLSCVATDFSILFHVQPSNNVLILSSAGVSVSASGNTISFGSGCSYHSFSVTRSGGQLLLTNTSDGETHWMQGNGIIVSNLQ